MIRIAELIGKIPYTHDLDYFTSIHANLSLWETNFQKIEQLEAIYPDSLPFVKFHVKDRHWDSSPDFHENGEYLQNNIHTQKAPLYTRLN